jgi:hypothetical protein
MKLCGVEGTGAYLCTPQGRGAKWSLTVFFFDATSLAVWLQSCTSLPCTTATKTMMESLSA